MALPESRFQCVTISLRMPRSPQTPPPSPSPPSSSPPQAPCPKRFSALALKYTLHEGRELDDDCFASNEGDESDTDTSDNDSGSGYSDDEVYTDHPTKHRALNSLQDMAYYK